MSKSKTHSIPSWRVQTTANVIGNPQPLQKTIEYFFVLQMQTHNKFCKINRQIFHKIIEHHSYLKKEKSSK
jgi:hypothetical protein